MPPELLAKGLLHGKEGQGRKGEGRKEMDERMGEKRTVPNLSHPTCMLAENIKKVYDTNAVFLRIADFNKEQMIK